MAEYVWTVVNDLTPPSVVSVEVVDCRTLILNYNEAVVEAEALMPGNYSVDNGLAVLAVAPLSSSQYRLTTSLQVPALLYTGTVTNVHDLAGNNI